MTIAHSTPVCFVSVASAEAGRSFYEGVLGLSHRSSDPFGDFYIFPNGTLLRVTPMPDFVAGPHPVLGWDVDDIADTVATLAGKGVKFTIYEGMSQDAQGIWTAPDGGNKVAWFADPFGNVLSLSQT